MNDDFASQKIADIYDQIGLDFSATRPKMAPAVISLLPKLPPHAKILDLGCGNGVLLTALPPDVDYTGIDISRTMIDAAQKSHPGASFFQADISNPDLWSKLNQYDFIAALAVLHHFPTPDDHLKLLRNIKQHLRENGTCLITVWFIDPIKLSNFHIRNQQYSIPFHPARNAAPSAAGGGGPNRPFYAFSEDELVGLARKAGFQTPHTIFTAKNIFLSLKN